MNKITLLAVMVLSSIVSIAQNNASQGPVSTIIPLSPLGSQEIFRFKPGIVTQLQAGTFGFSATDRWSSLGEITTPPSGQRLHGLRIQDEAKALVMGYSSAEFNSFIQYIGNRGLDIKFADSFTSTQSTLTASFNTDGSTDFGFSDPTFIGQRRVPRQVGILSRFVRALYVRKGDNTIPAADFIAGDFGGPIIATAATFTSDAQFKRDVKTEDSSLNVINALNPVTYFFKDDNKFGLSFSGSLQHGFVAQDLEKILPELVVTNNQEGVGSYKSVNYTGLIAILTKGIQELSAEVEGLRTQLAEAKTYVVAKENFTKGEMDKITENGYYLGQNVPNPFSNSTEIAYSYPKGNQNVVLMIFNLNGETLKEYKLKEEKGIIILDAAQFKPGLYLYSLISDNSEIITKKMLVK